MSDALRYPVGRFEFVEGGDPSLRARAIAEIGALPTRVREVAGALTDAQLATPYREGGWTARQVVHHIADSHINAYVRLRWLLTEDRPTIKAYDEKAWAELPDASTAPISLSLDLLTAVHARWHFLLSALPSDVFGRELVHPDNGPMTLDRIVQMYAWHGRHHVGHLLLVAGAAA
jgi:uncharacterized damage-inducible protein DinB